MSAGEYYMVFIMDDKAKSIPQFISVSEAQNIKAFPSILKGRVYAINSKTIKLSNEILNILCKIGAHKIEK